MEKESLIVQLFANLGGFSILFYLIKRQIDRRDTAFDKMVEVLNGLLTRVAVVEKDQEHMSDDIKELKERKMVTYPKK